ncbi:MAG: hypothetical protein ACI4DV_02375 [Lachnospiraceae bacterium]
MDKYEYKVKLNQIEKLVGKKDYITAAKIADGVDWRRVKSASTLMMIADIYDQIERYEDCYEILSMAYDRAPNVRRVLYQLVCLTTKMHEFEEAIELYKEYVKIAPHDLNCYILKYQIYRERGSEVTDQIKIMEEYKSHEYDEKWSYELACLYEEAGMIERCIEECDELILWFSEGEYVIKAMELKMKYQELTASQQEKYEHRFDCAQENESPEAILEETVLKETASGENTEAAVREEEPETPETSEAPETSEMPERSEMPETDAEELQEEVVIEDVRISPFNTSKFSTINLQEELAKSLAPYLQEETEEVLSEDDCVETVKEPTKEVIVREDVMRVQEADSEEPKQLSETEQLKLEIEKYARKEPEFKIEDLYMVEEDTGQVAIRVEDAVAAEKQITGQMRLEEILAAWEETKRQADREPEKEAEKKAAVLCETSEITGLLQDVIPRTPKETETEEVPVEEMKTAEPEEEIAEELSVELEDDLPVDLEELLVNSLNDTNDTEENTGETQSAGTEEADTESGFDGVSPMIRQLEKALEEEVSSISDHARYLTEEQEKLFAYFMSVRGMKNQLARLLAEDTKYASRTDSAEGNLVITGARGNGKTTLAIDIVKAFQKQRREKGGTLAKITGGGLNKKDPAEILKKLGGGTLIIERAGEMKTSIVEQLSAAMEEQTGGLLIILEDEGKEISRLFAEHEAFGRKFNRMIEIPVFTNDELVEFGKSYAEEQEYYFEEMAVLALYDRIGVNQTAEHVVNVTEVKEIIDRAIAHAEKKGKSWFAKLSKKRVNEFGNRLLLEEDFES